MGITYEEKVFFDILISVRDAHKFPYAEEKCLALSKEIQKLVTDKSKFPDWSNRTDIKAQLESDLAVLLYKHGYPPEWNKRKVSNVKIKYFRGVLLFSKSVAGKIFDAP